MFKGPELELGNVLIQVIRHVATNNRREYPW